MIITPQALLDIQSTFDLRYQTVFAQTSTLWQTKAMQINSTTAQNIYGWIADLPEMRKWIGPRVVHNMVSRAQTVVNEDWELTIEVDRNSIKYDQLNLYNQRINFLATGAARWKDNMVTDVQRAGTTSLCWDGQFFYDTDHPVNFDDAGAGTYSNKLSAMPLTADNLWTAASTMMTFKGESGRGLEVTPTILEVPPQLKKKANDVLNAELIAQAVRNVAGTENVAAVAATNTLQGMLQLVVNPRLAADPQVWYLHSTDRMMPFIVQVATEPTGIVAREDPQGEPLFHRKVFEYGVDASGNAAPTLPFLSIRVSEV